MYSVGLAAFWKILADVFGQIGIRKWIKNELPTAFYSKRKRGYKTRGKNRLLSWQRHISQ